VNTKDWLVIIHASDRWIDRFAIDDKANEIRYKIRDRALFYLNQNKKVYYTPYQKKEYNLPSYLNWLNIKNISHDKNTDFTDLIKFQIFLLRLEFFMDNIENVEIVWVWKSACLNATHKKINYLTKEEIIRLQDQYNLNPMNEILIKFIINSLVHSEINHNIAF